MNQINSSSFVKNQVAGQFIILAMEISKTDLLKEVKFRTSRSGGKGGQNVNKASSKVELIWDVAASNLFDTEQKQQILRKLPNRINAFGLLQVITEEERSQYLNKERSLEKLIILIQNALHNPKIRKASKPKRSSIEKRLKSKQLQSLKKINRRSSGQFD
ncbi:alternative ribosome rescue aminoacyl-tRNA hydrolase ArfB [Daejeonella oryzae]|uniref:alternative ribosome rescue aminoacyl-tRNA hydrolase ArfB n=1 Tax=Daejeonella oryzae TaxID=1122943 RepID=UPI00040CB773|nr:alternative ribosome rescue aminoacyl-tRNA hydrolase ArfB [Daejeonella oryzae]